MKKVIFGIALLGSVLTFSPAAFSQTPNGTNQNGQGGAREPEYEKLKTDLGLSDDQVTSWKNLEETYKPKMKAIRSNTALSEEDKKTQMKQLHESKQADLKKILTPDQYTKFEEIRRQDKGGKGGKGNH